MKIYCPLILLVTLVFFESSKGFIGNKVSYYEVIESHHIVTRNRRSIYSSQKHEDTEEFIKEVTIQVFNTTFNLVLKPKTELFAPDFKVSVVKADGSESYVPFPEGNFYSGVVEGKDNSEAHGYFEDEQFIGQISVDDELYVIESAWRHINDQYHGIDSGKMIAYRGRDVKWPDGQKNGKSFCKSVHADDGVSQSQGHPNEQIHPIRHKRDVPLKSKCNIYAVADYKFFMNIGRGDIYRTANYIAGVIESVDNIFTKTYWQGNLNGMGVELAEIKIYDSYTDSISLHHNMNKADWDTSELLQVFGRDLKIKEFCLGHLFTHQSFANNVLGLAYIASSRAGSAGGICSPTRISSGVETCFNTAYTTTSNTNGNTVLSLQSQLVTAHEIGHNWGSEHDPDTSECAPSSILGDGKYLMYPFSVAGYDPNNDLFSPCSNFTISAVLAAKAENCFKEPRPVTLCGNGIMDTSDGEECDAGFLGRFGQDICCTSSCTLRGSAKCSPNNHECCNSNCDIAEIGTVCRNDTYVSCKDVGYCSGNSLDCSVPDNADDGTTCLDDGTCLNGNCVGYCEKKGGSPCICSEVEESCLRCCRNATSVCSPGEPQEFLPDGRPCLQGYCEQGVCIKATQSLIQRLFSFLDKLTLNQILIFFRDNIVGCIIVFTLIIWIPISCCISYNDYLRERRFRCEFDIEPRTDRKFIFDEDKRLIQIPDQHKKVRTPKEIFVASSKKKY